MTLDTAKGLIPAVFKSRYSSDFLLAVANEILADIEEECDPDYFVFETALLLKDKVRDYALPTNVRHVRGLYAVPCGEVLPDRDYDIPARILNSKLRIDTDFIFSSNADVNGTANNRDSNDMDFLLDDTAGKIDSSVFSENQLTGRLLQVVHGSGNGGQTEYRVIRSNIVSSDPSGELGDSIVYVNGDFDAPVKSGESYLITDNFFILEAVRYLTRFAATTDVIPLSQDFEKLFRIGLTSKYHFQADELSPEAKAWALQYQNELDRFRIDTTKPRGMMPRNSPREMFHMYSDRVQ